VRARKKYVALVQDDDNEEEEVAKTVEPAQEESKVE